jgi:hypothetical protein
MARLVREHLGSDILSQVQGSSPNLPVKTS